MKPGVPSQSGSIALIGGHVALDLVNTVSWRLDATRRRENLATAADLLTWVQRAVALAEPDLAAIRMTSEDPDAGRALLRRVCELRELLYDRLLESINRGGEPPQIDQGSALHRAFVEAISASGLTGAPARWTLETGPLDLARGLALQGLDLMQTLPADRLRQCSDHGCGWLFLDTTRNHSRRWCSSVECGNRNRVRRHYARAQATNR